mmetsp:Transcript_15155/g.60896  ORF Transcript_15155/g.60896 Transcript_15155/m.60896 type:complete len:453 (+) Transcript_15155:153-1511(+)
MATAGAWVPPAAADIDSSVVAELPPDVAAEIRRQLALATAARPKPEEEAVQAVAKKNTTKKRGRAAPTTEAAKKQPKRYRQARETADGDVEVLCFTCRRAPPGAATQAPLTRYFGGSPKQQPRDVTTPSVIKVCARCRAPLSKATQVAPSATTTPTQPAQIVRLKSYKRLAKDAGVPFALTDGQALALMRDPCVGCGVAGGLDGNGISRLRDWSGYSDERRREATKSFMGPFSEVNCVAACATCNRMKGYRSIASFVEAARTVATHRTEDDFGRYPRRFRDNVSKRSRSSYITKSSTHTKTHALTNERFNAIVAAPCYYCGKPPSKTHHNGLDRLDSDDRVYTEANVVSCCGDCNIMKYKHSVDFFVGHCVKVARHHRGVVFPQAADSDDDATARPEDDDALDDDAASSEEAAPPPPPQEVGETQKKTNPFASYAYDAESQRAPLSEIEEED